MAFYDPTSEVPGSLLCPVLVKQSQCHPNSRTWDTGLSKNLQPLFETTTTYLVAGGKLPQVVKSLSHGHTAGW